METLKTKFRKKELLYTLIKRNDKVALYGIGGHFTDEIINWEVDIIYIRKDKYKLREAIPDDGQFGRDRSQSFSNEKLALDYFDVLTAKLYQGVPKAVSEVEEKTEVVLEYQFALSSYP